MGTVYKILIDGDNIIITSDDLISQAQFQRNPDEIYIPWIEIFYRQDVTAEILTEEDAQATIEAVTA
jgi:hypothetical protein